MTKRSRNYRKMMRQCKKDTQAFWKHLVNGQPRESEESFQQRKELVMPFLMDKLTNYDTTQSISNNADSQ